LITVLMASLLRGANSDVLSAQSVLRIIEFDIHSPNLIHGSPLVRRDFADLRPVVGLGESYFEFDGPTVSQCYF
jgi:hypothetical protein